MEQGTTAVIYGFSPHVVLCWRELSCVDVTDLHLCGRELSR